MSTLPQVLLKSFKLIRWYSGLFVSEIGGGKININNK
jgi:hypothetical protein